MRIIDAYTGRDVRIGETFSLPGGGWAKLVDISPGIVGRALNAIGYALFGAGLEAPKVLLESTIPSMDGKWVPLQVRQDHPKYPGQIVAFIPS